MTLNCPPKHRRFKRMKLITRETDYAIRALCCIARRGNSIVPVKELVKCLKVPKPFIRKLMQVLNREGILKSYKGVLNKEGVLKSYKGKGGGFELKKDIRDITVARLVEIYQGPLQLSDHRFKKDLCHEINCCPFKRVLDNIERHIKSELSEITIDFLINKKDQRRWPRER
jgi:DNA-binding IscR family transcriptional regulator